MKNYFKKSFYSFDKLLIIIIIGAFMFAASCTDNYYYDNKEPEWLGASIYDYLKTDGHFKNCVKLIDDLGYADVLARTGSKTLFVANDSAYTEFFKSNSWGVTSYEQLTLPQKKLLLYFSMVNNAYILETLSNYYDGTFNEGTAMRRQSFLSPIDSVPFCLGDKVATSPYWDYYRFKGMYLLSDNTAPSLVYFTKTFLDKYSLTDEDFLVLTSGHTRTGNDAYLFNNKIIKRDITCKNGYIHVLQSVLVPPTNMAQYISENSNSKIPDNFRTSIFSKLLDRFCAPFYDAKYTTDYKIVHPEFTDSIFSKHYFASNGGVRNLPDAQHNLSSNAAPNLLPYDPGWNSYKASALQADMAAMFVPSDQAMTEYFNSGIGAILKNRFGTWENVPDYIILPFIKRHMRSSLLESVPSRFSKMVDGENYTLPVVKSHIQKSYTGVNGVVYVTSAVYPPVDYISVYSPVLLSDNSTIMNWAINISEKSVDGSYFAFYKLYLNSLSSIYSLFIPTDEYFSTNLYIDPIAYGQEKPGALKFWYNKITASVNATVYKYDKTTKTLGDSVDLITSSAFIKNRLWNILDSHIVIGNVENGDKYFITKANDIVKVDGSGVSMTVQGGADVADNSKAQVTNAFKQFNGSTYFLNKQINPSLKSVYKILSETDKFSMFYNLLNGVPDTCVAQIFAKQGVDSRIKFFNAFRYTVYVPTNEAIQAAIDNNRITTWETIYNMAPAAKSAAIRKMIRFLKYHFQDNAVFFGQNIDEKFQSATIKDDTTTTVLGSYQNKYLKIGVVGSSNSLVLTTDTKKYGGVTRTANVVTTDGLYNIITKDYIFSGLPTNYKNIDGTGASSGLLFNTSTITTSASAVIHQIDNVLTFE